MLNIILNYKLIYYIISYVFKYDHSIHFKITIIVYGISFSNCQITLFFKKDQKYQQKCINLYDIHATKQTQLLSVGGLDIYCETQLLFNLLFYKE